MISVINVNMYRSFYYFIYYVTILKNYFLIKIIKIPLRTFILTRNFYKVSSKGEQFPKFYPSFFTTLRTIKKAT